MINHLIRRFHCVLWVLSKVACCDPVMQWGQSGFITDQTAWLQAKATYIMGIAGLLKNKCCNFLALHSWLCAMSKQMEGFPWGFMYFPALIMIQVYYEHHGVLILEWLFSLFRLGRNKTSKLCIYWPFGWGSQWWAMDSPHKGLFVQGTFPCHDVMLSNYQMTIAFVHWWHRLACFISILNSTNSMINF